MKVRVASSSADLQSSELGTVEADEAVRLFSTHPWQSELDRANQLEASGENCADPDMTFTALPAHLIVSAVATDQFNVEVCLPAQQKFLGIFSRSKFYQFNSVSQVKAVELVRGFCMDLLEQRHAFFAAQVRARELVNVPGT
jgi:hypothetical protein